MSDEPSSESPSIQDLASHPYTRDISALQCCCGRVECVFLQHNCSVLNSVERDVHMAAQLGQALLARHEAYMADAERDRVVLTTRIEQLEMDKKALEAENLRSIEENRQLLDQLEFVNNSVADSDSRVRSLEATLLSSQQAVRRLEQAASRASDMERHIALLEQEQEKLQSTIVTTEEEARSAMQRWKKAERGLNDLQSQLERMEKETREERERHVEILGRMERQREMERELDTAAGRLKGAAAAKSLHNLKTGSNVVSHFVRDLLQDNSTLQLGIAELREMLMNSNDEIQALRNQLEFHQPAHADGEASSTSTLRAELEIQQPLLSSIQQQELHVHHHYHLPAHVGTKKNKKKRSSLSAAMFVPPQESEPPTPTPVGKWCPTPSPAAPALVSHSARDSVSTISMPSNRWSVFSDPPSEAELCSVPSSPRSSKRVSSMFERNLEASVPSSPLTNYDPISPIWTFSHRKRTSELSICTNGGVAGAPGPAPQVSPVPITLGTGPIQEEEDPTLDDAEDIPGMTTSAEESATEESVQSTEDIQVSRPHYLRRTYSHESIMSLSGGLDIHTLKSRPSQLAFRPMGAANAVSGITGVTAMSTLTLRGDRRGTSVLRDSLANLPSNRVVSTPPTTPRNEAGLLGRWKGWRPWTGSPSSTASTTPTAPTTTPNTTTTTPATQDTKSPTLPSSPSSKDKDQIRPPGINQPGPIPGFTEYWAAHKRRAPSRVVSETVDYAALRDGLNS